MFSPVISWAGYWELVNIHHDIKHFNEQLVDKKYWSHSMSGSAGTGEFTTKYVGPTEKDDYAPRGKNGENATVKGSVSAPPRYIDGGQLVRLSVDLSITSTKQHLFDFDGNAYARFDEPGVPIGHVTRGPIDFTANDADGKPLKLNVWLYAPTNWRVKEYGNKANLSTAVFAKAPRGRKDDQKIALYTAIGMGNMISRTEYVYRWHTEGTAPSSAQDGDGSFLSWTLPGGIVIILIGTGVYILNRNRKINKPSRNWIKNEQSLKEKRDKLLEMAEAADKEGLETKHDNAKRLAHKYDQWLSDVKRSGEKAIFGRDKEFKKLNEMFRRFIRGDVGWEQEASDGFYETFNERVQRNWSRESDIWMEGGSNTIHEAVKGDTAKSKTFQVLFTSIGGKFIGNVLGVVTTGAETVASAKDEIEKGKSVGYTFTKVMINATIDTVTGEIVGGGTSNAVDLADGRRIFADPTNEKALRFVENTVTEFYSDLGKSAAEITLY